VSRVGLESAAVIVQERAVQILHILVEAAQLQQLGLPQPPATTQALSPLADDCSNNRSDAAKNCGTNCPRNPRIHRIVGLFRHLPIRKTNLASRNPKWISSPSFSVVDAF
jgi:hypothetical protein